MAKEDGKWRCLLFGVVSGWFEVESTLYAQNRASVRCYRTWSLHPRFSDCPCPAGWSDVHSRAIRHSPSDVGACHRVMRKHTCCSPATQRSMRATVACELRLECTFASQPQRPHQKRATRPVAAPRSSRVPTHRAVPTITNRHDSPGRSFRSHFALFWSFWLAISEQGLAFRKKKKGPFGIRLKSTRPSSIRSSFHESFVKPTAIFFRFLGCAKHPPELPSSAATV